MPSPDRSVPMPVKNWSFAGLLITYRCNARCQSCYLSCGPQRQEEMTVASAVGIWEGLVRAGPRGCRIHLSGGEPFGNWPLLLGIARAAKQAGLAPLEKVETNAFWADSRDGVADRLRALSEAGMQRLSISADPYHQQFVPLERARLAAAVAEEVLGPDRVQVRWRDWLEDGFDTGSLSPADREQVFLRFAAGRRDRMNGRAAMRLAGRLVLKPLLPLSDSPCREPLLRSRHVHVDPAGRIMPGTCAGILLGRCGGQSVADEWRRLAADHASRAIVGPLARGGPAALLEAARAAGFQPRDGYAGKCHLCWDIRRFLAGKGLHGEEIGPAWMYQDEGACGTGF